MTCVHAFMSGGGGAFGCCVPPSLSPVKRCPVLPLRSPGGAGAAGKGAVLRGVRSRSRKTIPLDPRSSEDPRPPADLR